MGLRDWFQKRETADTAWTSNFSADATFERWVTQAGTDFLPPDTEGWPVAQWSPTLRDAYVDGLMGNDTYAALYRSQPAVYTVVEFLSWQISQLSLKSYDRVADEDREQVSDSPVQEAISHPAPGLTYARLMHGTVADLGVFGNAYWALMDVPDSVSEYGSKLLVPLPPEQVIPRGGNLLEAEVYEWHVGSERRSFDASEICHFRRYNPVDKRIGISPLEPLRAVLREEKEAARYREVLWKRSARIGGFIRRNPETAMAPMDEESRKHFRAGMEKFSRGGRNESAWMLLEEGEIPVPMAFSPRDSEYLEGRKFALETVARAYNIPLPVLSLVESTAYASQKEHHEALYRDTLPPWTRLIEDEVQLKVVPWVLGTTDTNEYVEFNLEEKLRGGFEEQAGLLQTASGGPYMTRNEVRARLNLPKIDDPNADELVVTNNMIGTENGEPTTNPEQAAAIMQLAPKEGIAP